MIEFHCVVCGAPFNPTGNEYAVGMDGDDNKYLLIRIDYPEDISGIICLDCQRAALRKLLESMTAH